MWEEEARERSMLNNDGCVQVKVEHNEINLEIEFVLSVWARLKHAKCQGQFVENAVQNAGKQVHQEDQNRQGQNYIKHSLVKGTSYFPTDLFELILFLENDLLQ